jgi:ubiquinone/menaquinone biosynthesis C-methylase UbiE
MTTTTSISFDPAASFYDQTRHLSEPMATHGLELILDKAGPNGRILEVGAGTGRISVPLLERGADLIGCDLSLEMMGKLRAKAPQARLAQTRAEQLPFISDRFDVVITVHVLHLVGPWRQALHEIKRVLRPGGTFINNWNWHNADSPSRRIRAYWRSRVEAHGAHWQRPGVQSREELEDEIRGIATRYEEREITRWTSTTTPQQAIDDIASRRYSDAWGVPDEVYALTLDEVREWTAREFGDLQQELPEEHRFILDVATF